MNKNRPSRLRLKKETLRRMNSGALRHALGACESDACEEEICPSDDGACGLPPSACLGTCSCPRIVY